MENIFDLVLSRKSNGGSGGGGVKSWDELDGKPFGEETVKIFAYENCEIEIKTLSATSPGEESTDYYANEYEHNIGELGTVESVGMDTAIAWNVSAGEKLVVEFDGEVHELELKNSDYYHDANSTPYLEAGNLNLYKYGSKDASDGNIYIFTMGGYLQFYTTSELVGTHTISVYVVRKNIKQIDEKFMPTLTSPNGTKYKLTVSDDGTITATVVE